MKMTLYTVLFIIFLVLKLVGVIAWSWWWVTCPLWIPFAFMAIAMGFTLTVAGFVMVMALLMHRRDVKLKLNNPWWNP